MGIRLSLSRVTGLRFSQLAWLPLWMVLLYAPPARAQWNPLNPVKSSEKDAGGLTLFLEHGALRLEVLSDSIIRVLYSPEREFPRVAEYVVIKTAWPKTDFDVAETPADLSLVTARLKVVVERKDSRYPTEPLMT